MLETLMEILIVFLASLMLVASTEAATSSPKNKPLVGFENERLSVKAEDAPLKDLLSEIQIKSGIVIELKDSKAAAKPCSVDFKNLPPALAFQSILRDFNFAFFYSDTRLVRVLILPTGHQNDEVKGRLVSPGRIGRRFPTVENATPKHGKGPRLRGENTKDGDVTTKIEAIEAMEDSHDPKSIAALGEWLTDQHRKVKGAALRALAAKKAADVTETLRQALADRNQEVRETAADLLWNATTYK